MEFADWEKTYNYGQKGRVYVTDDMKAAWEAAVGLQKARFSVLGRFMAERFPEETAGMDMTNQERVMALAITLLDRLSRWER